MDEKDISEFIIKFDKILDTIFKTDINIDIVILVIILIIGILGTALILFIGCKVEELIDNIKYR